MAALAGNMIGESMFRKSEKREFLSDAVWSRRLLAGLSKDSYKPSLSTAGHCRTWVPDAAKEIDAWGIDEAASGHSNLATSSKVVLSCSSFIACR